MLIRWIPLLTALVCADASARDREPVLTDKGTVLAQDPYLNGSGLSEGRLEGFRKLYVADVFADGLKPAKPASVDLPKVGDLAIANPTSAWVDVTINGQAVGRIGPFREGRIHDVASGVYEIGYALPNGRTWTGQTATVVLTKAPVGQG